MIDNPSRPPDDDRAGGASPAEPGAVAIPHGHRPEHTRRCRMPAEAARAVADGRRAVGWSQRELAVAVGVSRPFITRIEAGSRSPSLRTAVALVGVLRLGERDRTRLMECARPAGRSSPWRTGAWL